MNININMSKVHCFIKSVVYILTNAINYFCTNRYNDVE